MSSFTGIFHTYRASVEINVLESVEDLVDRGVFHFKEGVYALQVDFADSFTADLCVVADVTQDVTTGEFVYCTEVDEQPGIVRLVSTTVGAFCSSATIAIESTAGFASVYIKVGCVLVVFQKAVEL